ncbi:MAG: response regulator [Deltaproteobacteria bacterium]|nr:response regulator [Deltaproteobacteria bacterium]
MKILVVDDSKLSRKLIISKIPEKIRGTVPIIQGANGQEAVDLFKEHQPDIVFLDLTMPVMDGYEALEQIKAYDNDARVYVITADVQKKAKEKVNILGAAALECKPIDEKRMAKIFDSIQQDYKDDE